MTANIISEKKGADKTNITKNEIDMVTVIMINTFSLLLVVMALLLTKLSKFS